jgi:hypothetical protein
VANTQLDPPAALLSVAVVLLEPKFSTTISSIVRACAAGPTTSSRSAPARQHRHASLCLWRVSLNVRGWETTHASQLL